MLDFGTDINAALDSGSANIYTTLEARWSSGTQYYTNCDIPLVSGGNRYQPRATKAPSLKQVADLSVDTYTFRIGNADHQLTSILNNSDEAGAEMIIGLAVTDANHQLKDLKTLRHGFLDGWDDKDEAALKIANETILWQRKTLRPICSWCPWPFKSTECGYAGFQTTCSRSYARCLELSNEANFGGHRFLKALSGKDILWGSRSWKIREEDGEALLPLLYGRCRVEGVRTYMGVDADGNMHVIAVFGEGPVQGLVSISGDPQIWINKEPIADFGSLISYEFYTGTATQDVCASLAAALPEWNDPLRYTCYAHLVFSPDDSIPNDPDIEALIDGLILYNPVTATSAFSNNANLVAYDHATRPRTRGGMGIDAARINTDSVSDAIDYCTDKSWTFDAPIADDEPCGDHQEMILKCFRGAFLPSATEFVYRFRDLDYESVVMDLTFEDFEPGSLFASAGDCLDRPNALKVEFINPDKEYGEDTLPVPDTALSEAEDAETVNLRGLAAQQAGDMGLYLLERKIWNKEICGTARRRCFRLQPLDLVTITDEGRGWDQLLCRVESNKPGMDMRCRLKFCEENAVLYDGVFNLTAEQWDNTSLPGPNDPVPSVIMNGSITEVQYEYNGELHTFLEVDFSGPTSNPWWSHAQVWVSVDGGAYKHVTDSQGPYTYGPSQEEVTITFKLVSELAGAQNKVEDWDTAVTVSHWVVGKPTGPGDLSSMVAVANGGNVRIIAAQVDEAALAFYEFRRGDSWAGGLLVDRVLKPFVALSGVRPGEHTFWGAACDTKGVYSGTPASALVEVLLPAYYTLHTQWTVDYDGIGTHDNTEHTTYAGEDALKCSHTGDVLSGTYTTPTQDLGSVQPYLIFGDFRHAFVSSATTFGGVMPDPTEFDDVDATNKTFRDIFQPVEAAQILATVYYSSDGDVWHSKSSFEILTVEAVCRYVYCTIQIIDPTLDANAYLLTLNMRAYTGPQQV